MYAGGVEQWSPASAIERMDRTGTETGVCSLTNPIRFPTGEELRKLARECNEYAARMSADHPGRFGSFAFLPLPNTQMPGTADIDASLKEIQYALDTLKADGVYIWTSYGDIWMGDPLFNPIYEELNRRRAPVYTHPRTANCCANLKLAAGGGNFEWETDTTRAIANTIFSGTAARYPNMPVIFSHGGGSMPKLVRRLSGSDTDPKMKEIVPGGFLSMARKLYYDTAQQTLPSQLWPLKDVVTASQMVFGTDSPYAPDDDVPGSMRQSGIFTDAELRAIDRDNALRILPRFRT